MSTPAPESLNAQFAALHAERVRTWEPAQLARNVGQRQTLVGRFDPAAIAQTGSRIARFTLRDLAGAALTLDELIAHGPAVLIFFRFANCPADNVALPYYQRQLWPALAAAGIRLVAVSPQIPERLREIRDRHDLSFEIASDPGNHLARRLGITFQPDDLPATPPAGWIGEITGTGTWELPQTGVVIVDPDRTLRFIAISPDWMDRTEAPEILSALGRAEIRSAA